MNDSYLEKDFGAWIVARKSADAILASNTNAVYSPACIYEGLRVIRLGAGGKTAEELDGLLGTGALDSDWLGLERIDEWSYDEYLARMAAGVWLDEKANPSDEFANACERESIPVTVTRLSNPTAGEEITRWISEKTEGLLSPSIDLDPRALACVASALYLKDAWEHEFPKESTERKPFHADGGDIDADFMVSEAELPLADTGVGTVVGYPLSNGATMSFLLVYCLCHFSRSGRALPNKTRIWDKGRVMGGGRLFLHGVRLFTEGWRLRTAAGHEFGRMAWGALSRTRLWLQ